MYLAPPWRPLAADKIDPPAGSCYFDMVLAHPAVYLGVNTVLLLAVFTVNSVLYVLTWRRIRQEACSIQLSVGRSQLVAASHVAAKNCMLFVIAFLLQVSVCVCGRSVYVCAAVQCLYVLQVSVCMCGRSVFECVAGQCLYVLQVSVCSCGGLEPRRVVGGGNQERLGSRETRCSLLGGICGAWVEW